MPALTAQNDLVRSYNVTASEVGALLDRHPYTSPTRIFDRLTAPAMVLHLQSEGMAIGSFMEPYVAKYAARKLGLRIRAATKTVQHPRHPLCATPDYIVLGQRMLLEIKVSSIVYGWTEDDLHPHYEWQARAQLACTDRDVCIVCVLVGSAFHHIPVVRDEDKERRMLTAVDEFWEAYMLPNIRPTEPEKTRLRSVTVEGK